MKRSKGVNSFKKRKKHGRKYSKRHKRTKYSKSKKYSKKSNKRSKYSKRRRRQRGGAIVEGLYQVLVRFDIGDKTVSEDEIYEVSNEEGMAHYKIKMGTDTFKITEAEHEQLLYNGNVKKMDVEKNEGGYGVGGVWSSFGKFLGERESTSSEREWARAGV